MSPSLLCLFLALIVVFAGTVSPARASDDNNGCCRGSNSPGIFTIHGLWPDYNDGTWASCCTKSRFDPNEATEEHQFVQSTDSNMKSLLPASLNGDNNEESILSSYNSWLESHPSALEHFEKVMNIAREKKIVVFLDYDGTLSQIVDDPDKANMSDAMRVAVREVASYFPTAIISGRSRNKVYDFVKLKNIYYAGSHGLDISTQLGSSKYQDKKHQTKGVDEKGNEVKVYHPAEEFLPTIQKIIKILKDNIRVINGSSIEDNRFCFTVHYRRVKNKEDVEVLKEIVESIMKDYPDFLISGGKEIMEIRPNVKWNKGDALKYFLDTLGFDTFDDVLPIYIGDDRTDEDAFKILRQIGGGFPIVVSSIAKETNASYSLRDPADVMTFLTHLIKWKNNLMHKTEEKVMSG